MNKAQIWLLQQLASGRLSLAGLVTHTITPEQLGSAYEGLLKDKDNYLGVLMKWV
jgi:threonine dehydrogenase-like Zn-dependent dehydrogenase